MAEQLPAELNSTNTPVMFDADSEMDGPDGATAALTQESLEFPATPHIEAFLENLVKARLADFEQQTIAQMRAWKDQEAVMQAREQKLLEDIKVLNDRLAAAERTAGTQASATRPAAEESRASEGASLVPSKRRKTTQEPAVAVAVAGLDGNGNRRITRSTSRRTITRTTNTGGNSGAAAAATGVQLSDVPVAPAWVIGTATDTIGGQSRSTRVTRAASRRNINSGANPDSGTHKATAIGAYPFHFSPAKNTKKTKKKTKKVVKATAEIFRYLPQDMPDDMGGLNKAMALHIRILWGLTDAKEVPKNPPAKVLLDFNRRFTNEEELYICQGSGQELIPRRLVMIGTAMSTRSGRIASQASLLEEHMLEYIQVCLARFGLTCWCPDLRLSAYSLYNAAMRIVALDTFKQALISHAYAHLGPNTKYASNMKVLVLLFDHFVFHYIKGRYQKEDRSPGTIANQLNKTPKYVARIRLAGARLKFLEENNYPQRYQDLIKTKATSDDEYDSTQKAWIVKRRPERSAKAEKFIRLLDAKRREAALQEGPRHWRERNRIVPNTDVQEYSTFHNLPDHMPVDYFDSSFFNKLQPKTRNRVAVAKASLLPNVDQSFTWNEDERLSDEEFTKKYGAALLVQYATVSDADLVNEDNTDDDIWAGIPDEDVMSIKTDTQDLTLDANTLTSLRESLSSRLSATSESRTASQVNLSRSTMISEPREGSMGSIHS